MHPAIRAEPRDELARLLPPGISCVETLADRAYAEVLPAELPAVARAAPVRRAEFATTRTCAREALAALGLSPSAIPSGPAGDPVWPPGVVGSLTHCPGYRAAALAPAASWLAIGIDAEPHAAVPRSVLDSVARPDELARIDSLPRDGTAWDRVLFSAKEAAYKAWFPRTRGQVQPTGIVVWLEPCGTFRAEIDGNVSCGNWTLAHRLVLTAVAVARRPPSSGSPR